MTAGTPHPTVAALCVGRPRSYGTAESAAPPDTWTTGIFKEPIVGARLAGPLGLEGDGQADLENHGGADKAICAYSADHYADWRASLGITPFEHGAFGENLTIAGLDERSVCIGDVWLVGNAEVQVSQPRQPCWKIGRKWSRPEFPSDVVASGRTGWYFRVLRPGAIERGSAIVHLARPHPEWTVEAANNVMHHRVGDAAALAALDTLSASWRHTLAKRLASAASR